MENRNLQQIVAHANLCDGFYTDTKALYLQSFGKPANVSSIYQLNFRKAFEQLKTAFADRIEDIYTYRDYNRKNPAVRLRPDDRDHAGSAGDDRVR